MKWEFTPELWRALRRGKIVAWVQLVAVEVTFGLGYPWGTLTALRLEV